jgi:hypothetical protein
MSKKPSMTNVNDSNLINFIANASRRVVYIAPGISEAVADALSDAWPRLGPQRVSVILDADPEVCRLGYGTIGGLQRVRDAASKVGVQVGHQAGLRIGVLINDDTTLIYSPTPLLIETGSTQPERPNGIQLDTPPIQLAKDIGLGEHPDLEQTVGLSPVSPKQIESVEADLANAPPVKFDLARRVRVFTSRFQFVELSMTGCFISRKKVPIPSSLVGLAKNKDVQRNFHAHFNLIPKGRLELKMGDRTITERSLEERRQSIKKRFVTELPGYGSVILRANKDNFDKEIDGLRAEVKGFADGVKAKLQEHIDGNCKAIVEALLPAVERNPPDEYTKTHGPNLPTHFLRERLEDDIGKAFGSSENLVKDMQVTVVFKDVAYESLVDKKFLDTARKAMPGIRFLHEEYEAAPSDTQ